MFRKTALGLTLAAGLGPTCSADDAIELALFRPRIDVLLESRGPREPEDAARYTIGSARLAANVPLGPTHLRPFSSLQGFQLLAQAQISAGTAEIAPLRREHHVYGGGLAITALLFSKAGHRYLVSVGAGFAEDEETISSLQARPVALGLGMHRLGERVHLVFGGAFTHVYGRPLAIPLLGAQWQPGPRWKVEGILPVAVHLSWRSSARLTLRGHLRAAGDRTRWSNDGDFPGEPETLYLRARGGQATLGADWTVSSHLLLLAQAGTDGARGLTWSDGPRDLLSFEAAPGATLLVGARVSFGRSLME